jgi:hypothetical protein
VYPTLSDYPGKRPARKATTPHMNPFHFITEQAASDIVASHSPHHIPAVDSRRPAQGRRRLAGIVAKAALLVVILLPMLGSPVLAASDMFAPVGGSGFTAFREIDGSLEFFSADAIGARRLHARGFSVDESVSFALDAPASTHPQSAPVLPPTEPTGVIVAVVDTGVDASHPWFTTHLLPGRSFVGAPEDWSDSNGHGTHVAGIVRQADPSARILPVDVFGSERSTRDAVVSAGIVWAVENGARVVNLSLGGTSPSSSLDAAIEFARSRDVVVVAAAGNLGDRGSPPSYPAANELTLAVAALDAAQAPAYFSNRGVYVDIAAFGVGVTSSVPGGGFSAWSGTSMAAPFVSGAAARLRAARPDVDAVATRGHLEATSRDLGDPGRDDIFGWGALDADRALAEAANLLVPPSEESAGQLQVRVTSRVGAIVLLIDSPTSSLEMYADDKLLVSNGETHAIGVRLEDRTDSRARVVIPALDDTALTIVANDLEGRAYETLKTTASPLPVAEPAVSLKRSRQSVEVTAVLPKVEGRVYLHAKSGDGELLVIWLAREGKATSVSHQFTSSRRIAWTVTVCLVVIDDLACGVATTNR